MTRSSAWIGPSRSPTAATRRFDDRPLVGLGQARRRRVDGLLEERALERVGLVEQRKDIEVAVDEQALERDFDARNITLDQNLAHGLAERRNVGRLENAGDALGRGDEFGRIVSADDAPARRQRKRLEDAGIGRPGGGVRRVVVEREQAEGGREQARVGERRAQAVLVGRRRHRVGWVVRQAERGGRGRGEHGGHIVDADDGGQRIVARVGLDPRDAGVEIAEIDLERGAVGERLEHRPLVRADGDLDVQRMRRADEISGPVRCRRNEQEKTRHRAPRPGRADTFRAG